MINEELRPTRERDPLSPAPAFVGSYIVLGFFVFMSGLFFVLFLAMRNDPSPFAGEPITIAILFSVISVAYWRWKYRPDQIIAVSAPEPVPLDAPITGNMRVHIQRREVVAKEGYSRSTYRRMELHCTVTFTETALQLIKGSGVLSYIIFDDPAVVAGTRGFSEKVTVADLVAGTVVIPRADGPAIVEAELKLREGLGLLAQHLDDFKQIPTTARDTFDL